MTCDTVRSRLPLLVYGELPATEAAAIDGHLASCPACQAEFRGFQRLPALLGQVPEPRVTVDLGRLYRVAAQQQARRWRRWGLAGAAAAAAVVLGILALRCEMSVEQHQLVLRWGAPPPAAGVVPSPREHHSPPPEKTAGSEEQLRLLSQLVITFSRDLEHQDAQQRRELALLRARLDRLQEQSSQRLAATERGLAALYTVQFPPRSQGEEP